MRCSNMRIELRSAWDTVGDPISGYEHAVSSSELSIHYSPVTRCGSILTVLQVSWQSCRPSFFSLQSYPQSLPSPRANPALRRRWCSPSAMSRCGISL